MHHGKESTETSSNLQYLIFFLMDVISEPDFRIKQFLS